MEQGLNRVSVATSSVTNLVFVLLHRNWKKISESFADRTEVQCLHRWQKVCAIPFVFLIKLVPVPLHSIFFFLCRYWIQSWWRDRGLRRRMPKSSTSWTLMALRSGHSYPVVFQGVLESNVGKGNKLGVFVELSLRLDSLQPQMAQPFKPGYSQRKLGTVWRQGNIGGSPNFGKPMGWNCQAVAR